MWRSFFSVAVLLAVLSTHVRAAGTLENLALTRGMGIPSALGAWPNARFSAGKACDGDETTGWLSPPGVYPVWLRVEWPLPVDVSHVDVVPFLPEDVPTAGRPGAYRLEIAVGDGWKTVASGDGAASQDRVLSHRLPSGFRTDAVRLVVDSGPSPCVGVSELRITGPKLVVPGEWAPRWEARWIWCEPSLVIPHREPLRRYFRRSFTVDDPTRIKEAWLLACAFDRLNNFWLNNRSGLRHSSLYGGSLRRAQVRRVRSDWFVSGENVIAAEVDDIYECGSQGLLAELLIRYHDGSSERIVTDTSWLGQEDQGVVPDWRKPDLRDRRWVPCVAKTWPNTRFHWLWNVPYPTVCSEDQLRLLELTITPPRPRPGDVVTVRMVLENEAALTSDYAVVVRLGQASLSRNHDFELWGRALHPDQLKTSEWKRGRHPVELELSIPDAAPDPVPVTLLVSRPEGGAQVTCDLEGLSADAYGVHLSLPVARGKSPAPQEASNAFPGCEVRTVAGTPSLFIGDRLVPPILWSSCYGSYSRYSQYAGSGVRIFRPLIQGGPICAPGEEDEYYRVWLSEIDRMLEAAIAVDPDVWLLPALPMDPHPEWLFAEPTEQMLGGRGNPVITLSYAVPDRGQVRPTFMSRAWRVAGAHGLERLVKHMASRP
ncbi:MAG: hypothetical protein HON70_25185, partial [Lentisphaerae bacterium]|nr:hypothetical protein [Lentisphaerota bacterium]